MSTSKKTVIFSAPGRWGKTTRSEDLRKEFGCTRVVDEWAPSKRSILKGALHLTNAPPSYLQKELGDLPGVQVVTRGW